jgi:hypothetical protein
MLKAPSLEPASPLYPPPSFAANTPEMATTEYTYRGRVDIGGVTTCPLSWSVHHNVVRDGR